MKSVSLVALATFATVCQTVLAGYNTIPSKYSNNSIRVKSWAANDDSLCDGGAPHYTGWADIRDRHLFFWYHEARNGKADAPLLIWFQGGPGGSSLHGMLYENGPCLIKEANTSTYNPESWTEEFNVIYLDQPAGVGFSYLDNVDDEHAYPSRTPESSLDVVAFIRLFYEAFPNLASTDLHLGGESFAGRYVPSVAAAILDFNEFFSPQDPEIIPLRSIMVGNPMISPAIQIPTLYDVSCYPYRGGQYPEHMDPEDCSELRGVVDRCEALLQACAKSGKDEILCQQPNGLCKDKFLDPFMNASRSVYDRRRRNCPSPGSCYPDVALIEVYLNSKEVVENLIEAPSQSGGRKTTWEMASQLIMKRYIESGDFNQPTTPQIERILEYTRRTVPLSGGRPVDVMIYVGTTDIICNAEGVLAAMTSVRWDGRTDFRAEPWVELPWTAEGGGRAGRAKGTKNFYLVEIEEAGHMVPYDQPVSSLKMAQKWLEYIHVGGKFVQNQHDGSSSREHVAGVSYQPGEGEL